MKEKIKDLKHKFDASEHGGAPLLGISRPVIKAHGGSDANAIRNALAQAVCFVQYDVNGEIEAIASTVPKKNNKTED